MKIKFDKVQEAFVDGRITLEEFIEILVDNFGKKKTAKILAQNIEMAEKKQAKELERESKQWGICLDQLSDFHLPHPMPYLACEPDSRCKYKMTI